MPFTWCLPGAEVIFRCTRNYIVLTDANLKLLFTWILLIMDFMNVAGAQQANVMQTFQIL